MVQGSSFLSTVVFLQPPLFSLFFFFYFFSSFLSIHFFFLLYTMVSVSYSSSTCESGVGSFSCPIPHLLEPSTLSCKTTCLLFRHHLHINAARELAGQHLMRRQQYFQIFVIPHPYPLFGTCPSPCRKVPLICYIKGLGRFLATSDRGFEMVIILRHG